MAIVPYNTYAYVFLARSDEYTAVVPQRSWRPEPNYSVQELYRGLMHLISLINSTSNGLVGLLVYTAEHEPVVWIGPASYIYIHV